MGALGPPALALSEGPELAGADPGAIAGAGARFRAASGRVASLGSSVRTAQGDLAGGAWLGFGAIAFEMSAGDVIGTYRVAEQVLAGVSSALGTLSSELAAAKAQAQAAERLAALVNTDTQTLNDAYGTRVRTQTATLAASLHHVMSVDDVAAVAAPTPAETAQSEALIGSAGRATALMEGATRSARIAWQRAAAAFDFATAQSPAVQSAVAAATARAAAKAEEAHQGSFWGGLANLGGFLALGALDVGADVVTDGAATPLDEADAGEMGSLGDGALADFAGGGASAAEVASAEEAALANISVDGAKVDGLVAQDTGTIDDGVGVDRGDGRDALGKFTGAGGYGKDAEANALANYADDTGSTVYTNQVRATIQGSAGMRYYDGLVENTDGTFTGIEVKSGTASRTAGQAAFDDQVLSGTPATAILDGMLIRITNVIYLPG